MPNYDFYTKPDNTHFCRETMTEEEAIKYAEKLSLRFEEVSYED